MTKSTVGAEALKRLQNADYKQGIVDTQREADKEYFAEIEKCVKAHSQWTEPFYIVILQKKERLMENVVRRYFLARQSLPTPDWDQTVWRYTPATGDMRFLWVLPDRNTAMWMASNPNDVPQEQQPLLLFVMEFLDHKLYDRYLKLCEEGKEKCVSLSDSPYSHLSSKVAAQVLQHQGALSFNNES